MNEILVELRRRRWAIAASVALQVAAALAAVALLWALTCARGAP